MLLNGKDVHATEVRGAADETVVVQRRIKTHTLHRIIRHIVPEHFVPIQINNNSVLVLNLEFICCEQGVHSKRLRKYTGRLDAMEDDALYRYVFHFESS